MMKDILKQTIKTMYHPIISTLYMVISFILGSFIASLYARQIPYESYLSLLNFAQSLIGMVILFLLAGLMFTMLIIHCGTGLIASEVHEGTIRLLVAKPLTRREILLGKMTGMFIGSYLMYLTSLFLFLTSFSLFSHVEGSILEAILFSIPGYLAYGFFVLFIFGSISTLLSVYLKKKTGGLFILLFIIFMIYALIPFIRLLTLYSGSIQEMYMNYKLYYFDMTYHLSLMFSHFIEYTGGFKANLEMIGSFTNLFVMQPNDLDVMISLNQKYTMNTLLPFLLIEIIYFLFALCGYVVSFIWMENKDF